MNIQSNNFIGVHTTARGRECRSLLLLSLLYFTTPLCHAEPPTQNYEKDSLSFRYPASWKLYDKFRFPGTLRTLSIETPETSLVLIEIYAKRILNEIPEYRQHDSSLKQFAKRYNGRDAGAKRPKKAPITQAPITRGSWRGLKETQHYNLEKLVDTIIIREFYRYDTEDEIVFITMNTSSKELEKTAMGMDIILESFIYKAQ